MKASVANQFIALAINDSSNGPGGVGRVLLNAIGKEFGQPCFLCRQQLTGVGNFAPNATFAQFAQIIGAQPRKRKTLRFDNRWQPRHCSKF